MTALDWPRLQRLAALSYCPEPECRGKEPVILYRQDLEGIADGERWQVVCGPATLGHELRVRRSQFSALFAAWQRGEFRGNEGMLGLLFCNGLRVRARSRPVAWGYDEGPEGVTRIGRRYAPWYTQAPNREELIIMTTQALVTAENVEGKVKLARFVDRERPDARALQVLAQAAVLYDLDPVLNEITIYEGRPYITADGWSRKITASPQYDGETSPRILTEAEKQARGINTCAIAVGITMFRKGLSHCPEVIGWGDACHPYRGNVVEAKDPWDMAVKRARVKAGRYLFRDVLPQINLPTYEDAPVDPVTGEIYEGSAQVLPPDDDPPPAPDPAIPAVDPAQAAKDRADLFGPPEGSPIASILREMEAALTVPELNALTKAASKGRNNGELAELNRAYAANLARLKQ